MTGRLVEDEARTNMLFHQQKATIALDDGGYSDVGFECHL
jgi:hypothetical protein